MSEPGWLLISGDITPVGGMDRANHALARYLAERAPVHLVTHRAGQELSGHPNVTVHRVWRPFGRHLLGNGLLARVGQQWAEYLGRRGFRVVVNGGNCRWGDINWVHCIHAAFPAPVAGGRLRQLKIRRHHVLAQRDELQIVRKARLVICNSQRTARDVTELLNIDASRVRVVYLAVDAQRFPQVTQTERAAARASLGWEDRPWVGFVGQLGNRVKNFDTLYAAWRELSRDRTWDANLAVAGQGAELAHWKSRAVADGLAGRIRFLGFRDDLPDVLAACDVVIHPARYDAYGLAVHEALCRGVPVLVSSAAGIAERYPPELTDLLLPDPDDAAALADRLRAWRRDLESWPARIAEFAANLRTRTWDDMAAEFVHHAESVS